LLAANSGYDRVHPTQLRRRLEECRWHEAEDDRGVFGMLVGVPRRRHDYFGVAPCCVANAS